MHHQFADAVARGHERIAQFRLYLVESHGLRHLDDALAILDAIVSVSPPHHRIVDMAVLHPIGTHCSQEALATIAGLDLFYLHIVMLCSQSFGARFVCLLAAHTTLETVKYQ